MKVVYIYKDFDIYNGLIETFILLAKNRSRIGYDFSVVVFRNENVKHAARFRHFGGNLVNLKFKWEDNPYIIWKLYKYMKRQHPDIVHTFIMKPNLYGRIAAFLAKIPVIISNELTHKDQGPTRIKRLRDRMIHPINGFLNRYTDNIICLSETMKSEWVTKSTENKFAVIPPPFDIEKVNSIGISKKTDSMGKDTPWVIGIVARLSEEKQHCDLLIAFRDILAVYPRSQLLVVGDGAMKKELMSLSFKMGIQDHVCFTGFQEDVFPFLNRMDLFVLPSRTEGLPMSIMEAMALGIPVVATRVGGIPNLVEDGVTGLLVKPDDPKRLGNTILSLLDSPSRMKDMGKRGRERILTYFHPDLFLEKQMSVYKNALASRKFAI
jgi:glycosyltransferase involved in cell wall biosynthesis